MQDELVMVSGMPILNGLSNQHPLHYVESSFKCAGYHGIDDIAFVDDILLRFGPVKIVKCRMIS